jgi:ribosomal protein S18 acetylase RimI-like enzyme
MKYIIYQDCEDYQPDKYKQEFIHLYHKIYAAAPFWEKFTNQEIDFLYQQYTDPRSILCFVIDNKLDDKLIGFSAAIPLSLADEELKKLLNGNVNISKTFQNTEIAVDPSYRNKGIGSALVDIRLEKIKQRGYKYVLMRTTKDGSMSEGLYLKRGFQRLPVSQQVYQARTLSSISEFDERIFYLKAID